MFMVSELVSIFMLESEEFERAELAIWLEVDALEGEGDGKWGIFSAFHLEKMTSEKIPFSSS